MITQTLLALLFVSTQAQQYQQITIINPAIQQSNDHSHQLYVNGQQNLDLSIVCRNAAEGQQLHVLRSDQFSNELNHPSHTVPYFDGALATNLECSHKLSKRSFVRQEAQIAQENSTQTNLKFFEKNQLFSAGILMAITSVLVVLLITALGISWLFSIQTPTQFEAPVKNKKA